MGSKQFKAVEHNLHVINNNIRRLEAELEAEEAREYDEEQDDYYYTDSAPLRCW